MRYIYSFLLYLILPFILLRFWWRGRKLAAYRERLSERLGIIRSDVKTKCTGNIIWIHAVSVGETVAAIPLVTALLQNYPYSTIIFTTTTPTSAARIEQEFAHQERVIHHYLPLDLPFVVKNFLKTLKPKFGLILESELWPNLLYQAKKLNIKLYLINARVSPRTFNGHKRWDFLLGTMIRDMLNGFEVIFAQSALDQERLILLGADPTRVKVIPNLKFANQRTAELNMRSQEFKDKFNGRTSWMAASTHLGEEEIILNVHRQLLESYPDLLLVLAPRHPQRFAEVIKLIEDKNLTVQKYSEINNDYGTTSQVCIVDQMGVLTCCYGAVDIAFVGGSLVPIGGHNLLEPAACGLPIISGNQLFNFMAVAELLSSQQALIIVDGEIELLAKLYNLLGNIELREKMGAAAARVTTAGGANVIEEIINSINHI